MSKALDHFEKEVEEQVISLHNQNTSTNEHDIAENCPPETTTISLVDYMVTKKSRKSHKSSRKSPRGRKSPNGGKKSVITLTKTEQKKFQESIEKHHEEMKVANRLKNVESHLPVLKATHIISKPFKPDEIQLWKPNPEWVKKYRQLLSESEKQEDLPVESYVKRHWNNVTIPRFVKTKVSLKRIYNREHYASCIMNDHIFIHGGIRDSEWSSDFIHIDTKKDSVRLYENLEMLGSVYGEFSVDTTEDGLSLPATAHHAMVQFADGIVILGGNTTHNHSERSTHHHWWCSTSLRGSHSMQLYYVSRPASADGIFLGIHQRRRDHREFQLHPVEGTEIIPKLEDFTVTSISPVLFIIFGGLPKYTGQGSNTLYIVSGKVNRLSVNMISRRASRDWPCERYAHSACVTGQHLYIFGGKNGSTYLNDLWRFDLKTQQFEEVLVNGLTPAPSAHVLMTSFSSELLLMGGFCGNRKYAGLSRYHIGTNQFHAVKVEDEHSLSVIGSNPHHLQRDLLLIGGATQQSRLQRPGQTNALCSTILHYADPAQPFSLLVYLNALYKDKRRTADASFLVETSNGTIEELFVHRAIIAARCPHLNQLIVTNTTMEDHVTVTLTPVEGSPRYIFDVLEPYIQYLYTGRISINGEKNVDDLLAFLTQIHSVHTDHISRLCTLNVKHLDSALEIVDQITKDCGSLLKRVGCPSSDIFIILDDGSVMGTHKVFLLRSDYFRRMLSSGLQEATENRIHFDQAPAHVVRTIITYLYTDQITVNQETALELWLFSFQFSMKEVVSASRKFIGDCLNPSNVMQVCAIALEYSDTIVSSVAAAYMSRPEVFEELQFKDSFLCLPKEMIKRIRSSYSKKASTTDRKREKKTKNYITKTVFRV